MEPSSSNLIEKTFVQVFGSYRASNKKHTRTPDQTALTTINFAKTEFSKCEEYATRTNSDVLTVLSFINKNTGIEQFRSYYESFPNYRLTDGNYYGDHALTKAAEVGNLILIYYITSIAKDQINLGNADGWIALHGAVFQRHIHAAKALILLGSRINTIGNQGDTPLSIALARGCTLKLIVLLLFYGERMPIPYTGRALHRYTLSPMQNVYRITEIAANICVNYRSIAKGLYDKNSPISLLPNKLIFNILNVWTRVKYGLICQKIFNDLKLMFPKHDGF